MSTQLFKYKHTCKKCECLFLNRCVCKKNKWKCALFKYKYVCVFFNSTMFVKKQKKCLKTKTIVWIQQCLFIHNNFCNFNECLFYERMFVFTTQLRFQTHVCILIFYKHVCTNANMFVKTQTCLCKCKHVCLITNTFVPAQTRLCKHKHVCLKTNMFILVLNKHV